jgi:hypothetical protein
MVFKGWHLLHAVMLDQHVSDLTSDGRPDLDGANALVAENPPSSAAKSPWRCEGRQPQGYLANASVLDRDDVTSG